jgi:putative RNA 2'-phosphotransferase
MNPQNEKRLSKLLSLMLRHEPEKFGLTLDENGFAPIADVLRALQSKGAWREVSEADIRLVVKNSDKQRYEIEGDKIRARYGHSVPGLVVYEPCEPPEILYHGTSPHALKNIQREGLRAMKRQYVHLSIETEQARLVGLRHHAKPIILCVRAREAWQSGVKFYQPESRLFLADAVPPQFIDFP